MGIYYTNGARREELLGCRDFALLLGGLVVIMGAAPFLLIAYGMTLVAFASWLSSALGLSP
jgi:hypothetical protein